MTSTAELSSPSSANTALTNSVLDADYTLEHKYTRAEGRIYLSRRAGAGAAAADAADCATAPPA